MSVSWGKWQASFSVTVANVIAQGTCGEALTWKLEPDGTLMIEGSGAMGDYTSNTPRGMLTEKKSKWFLCRMR